MGEATESYGVFTKVDRYCCAVLPIVCEHCWVKRHKLCSLLS